MADARPGKSGGSPRFPRRLAGSRLAGRDPAAETSPQLAADPRASPGAADWGRGDGDDTPTEREAAIAKGTASESNCLHAYRLGFNPGRLRLEVAGLAEAWGMSPPTATTELTRVGPDGEDATSSLSDARVTQLPDASPGREVGAVTPPIPWGTGRAAETSDPPGPEEFPDHLEPLVGEIVVSAGSLAESIRDPKKQQPLKSLAAAAGVAWRSLRGAWPDWGRWAWGGPRPGPRDPLAQLAKATQACGPALDGELKAWFELGGLVEAAMGRDLTGPGADLGPGPEWAAALGDKIQQMAAATPWLAASADFSRERWGAARAGAGDNSYTLWARGQAADAHELVVRRLSAPDARDAFWVSAAEAILIAEDRFGVAISPSAMSKLAAGGVLRSRQVGGNRRDVEVGDFLRHVFQQAEARGQQADGVGDEEAAERVEAAKQEKRRGREG